MSFSHSDFHHSSATLKRVASYLLDEGYINEQEHYRIFECISAAGLMGADKHTVELLSSYVKDTPANRKHVAIKRIAMEVVDALGAITAATSLHEKREAIRVILTFLNDGKPVPDSKLSPQKKRKSSKYPSFNQTNYPVKQVILSELLESEKDKYYDFLVQNNIQFYKETDGSYVANVKFNPPGSGDNEDHTKNTKRRYNESSMYGRRVSRPPNEMGRIVGALTGTSGGGFGFDFETYPKFSSLITLRNQLRPKKRPLSWLMRLIEEIYDARFIHDSADFKDDGTVVDKGERLSNLFPVFVVDFFSKRYGLRKLVDQTCWDLLFNVHMLRTEHLEVEVFARFLEEFYDPDDLLFFLYVRSVVQKEIAIHFRNRWNELGRGRERMRETIWLSYRSCVQVSRVVFVSERDPLFQAFMDMIERHLVGAISRKTDTRRIEVMQFLHLALAEYHETRPSESDEGEQMRNETSVNSRQEQERLFREAENQYNAAIGSLEETSDVAVMRQKRILEMEKRIRDEIAQRRSSTLGESYEDLSDNRNPYHVISSSNDENRKKLLLKMSHTMQDVSSDYLNQVMVNCKEKELPAEIIDEIRKEVHLQLDAKVEQILKDVVDSAFDINGPNTNEHVISLRSAIQTSNEIDRQNRMTNFCQSIIGSADVRQEIEPLVALLTTFAVSNLQQHEEEFPEKAIDDKVASNTTVRISRQGSVDIEFKNHEH